MSRFLLNGQDLYGNAPQTGDKVSVVDTEGIVGQAGSTTNSQALFDGVAGDLCDVKTDLPNLFPRSEQRVQGAKNHLRNEAYTQTIGVVTFTVDADGIIDVDTNGQTTTAAVSIRIYNESSAPELPQGDWILNGCPTGGASTTYEIYYMERDSAGTGWENICRDYGTGVNISRGNNRAYAVVLQLRTGQTFNHLKFKPMIRLSTDTDPTFAPFAMTNRELTESVSGSAEDVSFTIAAQTKYEYRSISSIKRRGNFIQCSIRIQSLTGNELPTGKTYTNVLTGLPKIATDLDAVVPSGTSLSNYPMQIVYFKEGILGVRGGSTNDYYNVSFWGLIV